MMVSNQARNTEAMEMALNGVQDQFLTNSGNVLISNPKRYFFFDLRFKTVLDEEMDSQNRFLSFWETYRLFIIVVVIAFIIVLLSYTIFSLFSSPFLRQKLWLKPPGNKTGVKP